MNFCQNDSFPTETVLMKASISTHLFQYNTEKKYALVAIHSVTLYTCSGRTS